MGNSQTQPTAQQQQQQTQEGAAVAQPLKRTPVVQVMVWVNCGLLIFSGIYNTVANIINFLDPTVFVLAVYIAFFGVIGCASQFRFAFALRFFGFMQDWLLQSIFFIFVGTLGISFGPTSLIAFIVGIVSCCVGVACIIDHFAFTRRMFIEGNTAAAPTIVNVDGVEPTPSVASGAPAAKV